MNLSVSETEINKVEKNQEVTINLSAIDNKTYTGKIKSVSGIGTYQASGTTFSAVVEFENDGNAKPGMSATCSIVIEKAENCVAVPIDSVQTDNDGKYVVKVNDDGTTENVTIETGISNSSYVQVTSGLTAGEKIQMVQIVTSTSKGGSNGRSSNNKSSNDKMNQKGEMPSGEMPSGDMQAPSGENPGGFNAEQK
jgi:HlyD family secretion protein